MKKLIRQWLCEHKNVVIMREIIINQYLDGKRGKGEVLEYENWGKCKNCGKLKHYQTKF